MFFPRRVIALLLLWSTAVWAAEGMQPAQVLRSFERPGSQPEASPVPHSDGGLYGVTAGGGARGLGSVYRVGPDGAVETLHSFSGPDGQAPATGLVEGPDGLLYGSASSGGASGFGTLFRITPEGEFTLLLEFTGMAGAFPGAVPGLLQVGPEGEIYGVAQAGGAFNEGTVYRLGANGEVETLLEFTGKGGAAPGSAPVGPLARRGSFWYGVTRAGGANGLGQVFRLADDGSYLALGAFSGASGAWLGANPSTGLLRHSTGDLYGATEFGGPSGLGVLFRLDSEGGSYEALHRFAGTEGSKPSGPLAEGAEGAVYGVASTGGSRGYGGAFRIDEQGDFKALVALSGVGGPAPGASPKGGLIRGGSGLFYGAASAGGPGQRGTLFTFSPDSGYAPLAGFSTEIGWAPSGAPAFNARDGAALVPLAEGGAEGAGTVVRILDTESISLESSLTPLVASTPVGALSMLETEAVGIAARAGLSGRGSVYRIGANGVASALTELSTTAGEGFGGPLLLASDGAWYGVARAGGLGNHGTVFTVSPAGSVSRVFSFTGQSGSRRGSLPSPPLVQGSDGLIYGVTEGGGAEDAGTLFRFDADGVVETLVEFAATGPRRPKSGLVAAGNGKFYGSLQLGGAQGQGAIFEFDPVALNWTEVAAFTGDGGEAPGSGPGGGLVLGADGALYGLATEGGQGFGTAYRFTPGEGLECLAVFTGYEGEVPGIVSRRLGPGLEVLGGVSLGLDGGVYVALPGGGAGGGGVILRIETVSPYERWKEAELGDMGASELGDPDGDGLSNFLEYALGRSPATPDRAGLLRPQVAWESGQLRLSLALPLESVPAEVTLVVEAASSPLGPWAAIATSEGGQAFAGPGKVVLEEAPPPSPLRVRVIDPPGLSVSGSRFLRLRASR